MSITITDEAMTCSHSPHWAWPARAGWIVAWLAELVDCHTAITALHLAELVGTSVDYDRMNPRQRRHLAATFAAELDLSSRHAATRVQVREHHAQNLRDNTPAVPGRQTAAPAPQPPARRAPRARGRGRCPAAGPVTAAAVTTSPAGHDRSNEHAHPFASIEHSSQPARASGPDAHTGQASPRLVHRRQPSEAGREAGGGPTPEMLCPHRASPADHRPSGPGVRGPTESASAECKPDAGRTPGRRAEAAAPTRGWLRAKSGRSRGVRAADR